MEKSKYYVVRDKALPEVLQKVAEAKQLLDKNRSMTVQEVVSDYRANILTIHQTIPVNGIATVTLSVEVRDNTGDMSGLVEEIENMTGIQNIKILGVER